MSTLHKSIGFWIAGAGAGALIAGAKDKSPVIGGIFGGMLFGSVGELLIEHKQRLALKGCK